VVNTIVCRVIVESYNSDASPVSPYLYYYSMPTALTAAGAVRRTWWRRAARWLADTGPPGRWSHVVWKHRRKKRFYNVLLFL